MNADESITRVVCEYCGMTVIVEDSKQEGYNHELGAMQARANVSGELADAIKELTGPLCDFPRVVAETNDLRKQKTNLSRQVSICEKSGKQISIAIPSVFSLLLFLILSGVHAHIVAFIIFGLISVALFAVVPVVVLQYWDNVVKGVEDTEKAIQAHEKTLTHFNEIINAHRDVDIPEKYRTPRAMEFISDAIRSQKANSINHAISQFEDVLRQEKVISLQEEQIRLQKQQIEEMRGNGTSHKSSAKGGRNTIIIKQRGHSIIFHLILLAFGIGFFTIPYYTLSKKHYWHL